MNKRFVVECTWSGYRSSQSRVCHRTVERYGREAYGKLRSIRFTDGTYMTVLVRDCTPREGVKEIHGYDRLLSAVVRQDLSGSPHVDEINL